MGQDEVKLQPKATCVEIRDAQKPWTLLFYDSACAMVPERRFTQPWIGVDADIAIWLEQLEQGKAGAQAAAADLQDV
jgi:hypothetical protein